MPTSHLSRSKTISSIFCKGKEKAKLAKPPRRSAGASVHSFCRPRGGRNVDLHVVALLSTVAA